MRYTEEERYWIWLASVDGIGIGKFNKLVDIYGLPENVIRNADRKVYSYPFMDEPTSKALLDSLNQSYIDAFIESMDKQNIRIITQVNNNYPDLLKTIYNPPLMLYCKGNTEVLRCEKKLSVVGTRRPTRYGSNATVKLCAELAHSGVCIVSGMARGIDTYSHRGALEGKGTTIAVLGCGVDIIYPPENKDIYHKIIENGVIISEYKPGTEPVASHFPVRNRIISGLSKALLVVEASKKSGTLITIEFAQEQGRDVLAIPGNIDSIMSETPNNLIKEGCAPITSSDDILSWCGWGKRASIDTVKIKQLDLSELTIINVLSQGETLFDELLASLDFTRPQLMTMLLNLELKGIIEKLPGNKYAVKVH